MEHEQKSWNVYGFQEEPFFISPGCQDPGVKEAVCNNLEDFPWALITCWESIVEDSVNTWLALIYGSDGPSSPTGPCLK